MHLILGLIMDYFNINKKKNIMTDNVSIMERQNRRELLEVIEQQKEQLGR